MAAALYTCAAVCAVQQAARLHVPQSSDSEGIHLCCCIQVKQNQAFIPVLVVLASLSAPPSYSAEVELCDDPWTLTGCMLSFSAGGGGLIQ